MLKREEKGWRGRCWNTEEEEEKENTDQGGEDGGSVIHQTSRGGKERERDQAEAAQTDVKYIKKQVGGWKAAILRVEIPDDDDDDDDGGQLSVIY